MVIGSQYRGGGGVFPQMPNGTDEYGGADVLDVLALPSVAAQIADIDEQRIGLLGRVRGSMMSFLAAKAQPNTFKAIASAVTISDLNAWVDDWGAEHHPASRYIPNFATDGEAQMRARSAVQWADELPANLPILLIHGGRDWEVDRAQSEQFAAALEAAGRQHELTIYSHANHQLAPYQDDFITDVIAFFRANCNHRVGLSVSKCVGSGLVRLMPCANSHRHSQTVQPALKSCCARSLFCRCCST